MYELASYTSKTPFGVPGALTSLPVTSRRTRGRLTTLTWSRPKDAASPTSCGRRRRPTPRAAVPARRSSPRWPTCWPGATGRVTTICPAASWAYSAGTTESTPSGTGAPVMIRTAPLGGVSPANGWPGKACPTTRNSRGLYSLAPPVSAPRSAKPSMAARSKSGTSSGAITSAANVRPQASSSGTDSASSRDACWSIHSSTAGTSLRSRKPCMRTSGITVMAVFTQGPSSGNANTTRSQFIP